LRDEPQNLLEHLPCDGDLGHLGDNITAVAHYLRADLDQLVLQTRQRPVLDRLRRRQRAQEIAEVVGERMSATMPSQEPDRSAEAFRRVLPELRKLERYERRSAARRDRAALNIVDRIEPDDNL